ncbi:MAG TPA: alpha/beta fold hydrolase [Ktedonobacteraceae bacterium]|nr:alpha/beta fold hydrolase [Ktedonobacteraceae bacterium]
MFHRWFPYRKPNAHTVLRLLCFPYDGGGASIYRQWHDLLPSSIEVWAIQLPGRENRIGEEPLLQLSHFIKMTEEALFPFLEDGTPYAFFGHSMGALLSFELTQALRKQGYPLPVYLFVSGRSAPQRPLRTKPTYNLPEDAFIEALKRLNGTPEEVLRHRELLQLILPILRADFQLCETYSYKECEPLPCSVMAFGGTQDVEVTHADLAAWECQTREKFSMRMFDGDHFFLHKSGEQISREITRALFPFLW